MSDNENFGFGKFVPGFDFLQNIAKGASQTLPQMPSLSNWIAPTLNVEELDKRLQELKAVHFWLDQNSKALGATIQALEVQKMTLATLKGMNFNMGEVANALKLKAADTARTMTDAATEAVDKTRAARKTGKAPGEAATGVVDPMQWWGSLTQQFQQIASSAMKDAATQPAMDAAPATGSTTGKRKPATKRTSKSPAKKASAR